MFPHFFVIGAMKAGTTTINDLLARHPEIEMTKHKEPDLFFTEKLKTKDPGREYERYFSGSKPMRGEASPNYTRVHLDTNVPANLHRAIPEVKLIYLVRDPIERIVSHLQHDLYRDRLKLSEVGKTIRNNQDYVMTSSYGYQLKAYLKYFKRENILIIPFEKLITNTNAEFQKVMDFIGVNGLGIDDVQARKLNSGAKKYLIRFHDPAHKWIANRKIMKLYHAFFYFLNIKIDRPKLVEDDYRYIIDRVGSDISEFTQLAGYPFPEWKLYHEKSKQYGAL